VEGKKEQGLISEKRGNPTKGRREKDLTLDDIAADGFIFGGERR